MRLDGSKIKRKKIEAPKSKNKENADEKRLLKKDRVLNKSAKKRSRDTFRNICEED